MAESPEAKPLFYVEDVGFYGAPTRTRTADLLITNQLLYQLSYRGTARSFIQFGWIVQDVFCVFWGADTV